MELLMLRSMQIGLLVLFGACTADIAPDTYYCGPERLCPDGLACSDADNICVAESAVQEFGCGVLPGENPNDPPIPVSDPTGDDTPTQGLDVSNAGGCFATREFRACLFDDDPGDWFQFDLPANCGTSVKVSGRLTFAVAFEHVGIQVAIDGNTPETVDVECDQTSNVAGQTQRCFEMSLTSDSHYAVGLVHSGILDCDGTCAHNRYLLDLRLEAQ
jgi:hypothetical protein